MNDKTEKSEKKEETKMKCFEALDKLSVTGRKRFVAQKLFSNQKDSKTLKQWTSEFKSKKIIA